MRWEHADNLDWAAITDSVWVYQEVDSFLELRVRRVVREQETLVEGLAPGSYAWFVKSVDQAGNVTLNHGRYRVTANGTDSAGNPFTAEKRIELVLKPSLVDLDAPPSGLGDLGLDMDLNLGSDFGGIGELEDLGLGAGIRGRGNITLPPL